ncbi:MAG: ATP-binding cassette domain-containing protein [Candidatus Humimicrobiaceae bacterium]
MLNVSKLTKIFNTKTVNENRALYNVSFSLEKGEFVTLIGGNGSGKSTLLNCIAGVYSVDQGKILIDGRDVTNLSEYKRAVMLGRVFQDPVMGTASNMGIEENLALALRRGQRRTLAWGIRKKEREQYKELLRKLGLGLENRLSTKVGLLSGGQRQALTLLMATLKKPKLLLLDEHTAALDPKTAQKVLKLSNRIIKESNLTTLMVTHNMKDAIKHGNRLMMMHEGQIILDIRGEEKQRLTVENLLDRFGNVSGEEFTNDQALLS